MRAADTPSRGTASGNVERGRGGFYRKADDTPYVTDPSGALVKSGARKGLPVRLAYGSPSNRGKLIESSANLTKWTERRVVLGLGVDDTLLDDCRKLVTLDVDSDAYKTLADSIVIRAKDAAKANLAAEIGTHVHAVTEDHDEERDWVQRAEAGEVLGVPLEVQAQAVEAWQQMLDTHGLEVLAVEASCVDDTWRLAGTLDRIVRCTKALRFRRVTGEIVEIPAGTIVVGDVKTSKKRLDRDGVVGFWASYAIQIASYAQAVPYDTEAETRGEWPWPIDQTHALILRPNVVEVLAGEADTVEWELLHVDLVAGREHGGAAVVAAKSWGTRRDIFSVAQIGATTPIAVSAPDTSPAPLRAGLGTTPDDGMGADAASVVPSPEATLPPSPEMAEPPAAPASVCAVEQQQAGGGDSPGSPPAELDNQAESTQLSPLRQAQLARMRIDAEADAKRRLHTVPEEGDMTDDRTFHPLQVRYHALPPAGQAWIKQLSIEAEAAGVGFSAKHTKSVRRYEILRSLVACAADELSDDDVRGLLWAVIGDVAQFPTVPLGHLVGSLTTAEAATFAGLATHTLSVSVADDGRAVIGEAA